MVDYDASNLQAALDASSSGDTLWVATGTHTFVTGLVFPAHDVTVRGRSAAFLEMPTPPSVVDLYGVTVNGGVMTTIRDLTFVGPTTNVVVGPKFHFGIYVTGTPTLAVNAGLTLTNVTITRPAASAASAGFYRALYLAAGAGTDLGAFTLTITDCDLSAGNGVLNYYADPNTNNKSLIAVRSTFHTTGASHLCYIHPGISFDFTDCTFQDCPNYALQHYSAGAIRSAEYARFIGCTFGSDLTHGVLTSDQSGALTLFRDCQFYNTADSNAAIMARTSINVYGCNFDLGAAANGIDGVNAGIMDIIGCEFRYTGSGGGAAVKFSAGSASRVSSCTFDLRSGGTFSPKGVHAVGGSGSVDHCHFHASKNNPPLGSEAPLAMYVGANGSITSRYNVLTGYYQGVYGAMHSNHDTAVIDTDYDEFYLGSGIRPAYQTPGTAVGGLIWGAHNVNANGVLPSIVS